MFEKDLSVTVVIDGCEFVVNKTIIDEYLPITTYGMKDIYVYETGLPLNAPVINDIFLEFYTGCFGHYIDKYIRNPNEDMDYLIEFLYKYVDREKAAIILQSLDRDVYNVCDCPYYDLWNHVEDIGIKAGAIYRMYKPDIGWDWMMVETTDGKPHYFEDLRELVDFIGYITGNEDLYETFAASHAPDHRLVTIFGYTYDLTPYKG